MKRINQIFCFVTFLVLSLAAVSCSLNALNVKDSDLNGKTVKVSFTEKSTSRAATFNAGNVEIAKYSLFGTYLAGGADLPEDVTTVDEEFSSYSQLQNFTKELMCGSWSFTLEAYPVISPDICFTDIVSVDISSENNAVAFTLGGLTQGQYDIEINVVSAVKSVKRKIINLGTNIAAETYLTPASNKVTEVSLYDVGSYLLELHFYSDPMAPATSEIGVKYLAFSISAGAKTEIRSSYSGNKDTYAVHFEENHTGAQFVASFSPDKSYSALDKVVLPDVSVFETTPGTFKGWSTVNSDVSGFTFWNAGDYTENLILFAIWDTSAVPGSTLSNITLHEYGKVSSNNPAAPTGTRHEGTLEYLAFDPSVSVYDDVSIYTTNPYALTVYKDNSMQVVSVKQNGTPLTAFSEVGLQLQYEIESDPSKSVEIYVDGTLSYTINLAKETEYYVRGSLGATLDAPPDWFDLSGSKEFPFNDVQTAVNVAPHVKLISTETIYVDGTVTCAYVAPGDGNSGVQISESGVSYTITGYTENGALGGTIKPASSNRVIAVWPNGELTLGSNLTITGGNCSGDCGGGVFNGGILILDGCTITGNTSLMMGGGVYSSLSSQTNIKSGTIITNNTAESGGGIAVCGGVVQLNTGCSIGTNTATSGVAPYVYVKTYVNGTTKQNSTLNLYNGVSLTGYIYLGDDETDSEESTLEKISIKEELSSSVKIRPYKYTDGSLVLTNPVTAATANNLKVIGADGNITSDWAVSTEGKLVDLNPAAGGNGVDFDLGDITKTTLDIGSFTQDYVSKSETRYYFEFTVPEANRAYLNPDQIHCVMYNSQGAVIKSENVPYVTGSGYQFSPDAGHLEVGEYTIVVSAVSSDENYVFESKVFTVMVVY